MLKTPLIRKQYAVSLLFALEKHLQEKCRDIGCLAEVRGKKKEIDLLKAVTAMYQHLRNIKFLAKIVSFQISGNASPKTEVS